MDFDQAADELYGTVPERFVAARSALAAAARADGDAGLARRISALRRPAVSAWAVNLLVRAAGEKVAELLEIGSGLRSAWSEGTDLAEWERRRNRVVPAVARTAGELAGRAGHPLRDQARREVEETLQAAVVDPDVAAEVRAGRLTGPRSHVGFAAPGLPGPGSAPAETPPSSGPRKRAEDPRMRLRRLMVETAEAEERAADLEGARVRWEGQVTAAQQQLGTIEEDEDRLRRELDAARERREAAGRRLEAARREYDQATRSADTARRHAETARHRMDEAHARTED
jgi:hypothetical protein